VNAEMLRGRRRIRARVSASPPARGHGVVMDDPQPAIDAIMAELRTLAIELGERRVLSGPPYNASWHRSIRKVLREWRKRQPPKKATWKP
jgi:hypothetical protein